MLSAGCSVLGARGAGAARAVGGRSAVASRPAGEPSATVPSYHGESRPYSAFADPYKSGHAMPPLKTDHPAPPYGHYNWSPT